MKIFRLCKVFLVWAVALFAGLVAWGNFFDPDYNFELTRGVITMAWLDESQTTMNSRALSDGLAVNLAFTLIVFAETLVCLCCFLGGIRMLLASTEYAYFSGVAWSTAGLVLGILLWFVGFVAIGGEYFQSWHIPNRSGITIAFQFSTTLGIILIFLHLPEPAYSHE